MWEGATDVQSPSLWRPGVKTRGWILQAQKSTKNEEPMINQLFHKNLFFDNFQLYLRGLGVSRGMAWTIRCYSLELWPGLVFYGMGDVGFHVFWILETHFITKYLQICPRASRLVLGFFCEARVTSQELPTKNKFN